MGQLRPGRAPGSTSCPSGLRSGHLGPPLASLRQPSLLGQWEPQLAPCLRLLGPEIGPNSSRAWSPLFWVCMYLCLTVSISFSMCVSLPAKPTFQKDLSLISLILHGPSKCLGLLQGDHRPPLNPAVCFQASPWPLIPSPFLSVFRVPPAHSPRLLELGGLSNQSQGLPLDPAPALRPSSL